MNPELTLKKAEKIVNDTFDLIENALVNGEMVKIKHFGTFSTYKKQKKQYINPQNGETITIEAHMTPKITFSETIKHLIKGKK